VKTIFTFLGQVTRIDQAWQAGRQQQVVVVVNVQVATVLKCRKAIKMRFVVVVVPQKRDHRRKIAFITISLSQHTR